MAEHRETDERPVAVSRVQVRVADAGRQHPHLDLAGAGGSTTSSSMLIPSDGSWNTAARTPAEDRVTAWTTRRSGSREPTHSAARTPAGWRAASESPADTTSCTPRRSPISAASGTPSSQDLALPFAEPYGHVLDESAGPEWPRWFVGGRLNLAHACAERFADDPAHAARDAVAWEGEEGVTRSWTYAELARETARLAEGLHDLGVRQGDSVALLLPMVPEAAAALYAVASLGALAVPIFSGFSAPAVASRLIDSGATVLITCDAFPRRGRPVPAKETADRAAAEAPALRHVVVLRRLGVDVPWQDGRDVWYHDLVADRPGVRRAVPVDSEHPVLLGYTSGTTGRPKGAVHVHGGLLVKFASETAYIGDLGPDDRVHWATDLGWIMGPWLLIGTHALGGCVLLFDGAPDFPDPGRLWRLVADHRLTFLGVSPTLVRALRSAGDEHHRSVDLSSLAEFGSTGEPWNPEPYRWLADEVGGGRVPIMNISGGTEVGACFLGSPPYLSHKACSLGRPALGMAMDVYAPDGSSLADRPGEVGELVCTRPWPAQTRGVFGDPERYLDAYWRRFPGVWTARRLGHGRRRWRVVPARPQR